MPEGLANSEHADIAPKDPIATHILSTHNNANSFFWAMSRGFGLEVGKDAELGKLVTKVTVGKAARPSRACEEQPDTSKERRDGHSVRLRKVILYEILDGCNLAFVRIALISNRWV